MSDASVRFTSCPDAETLTNCLLGRLSPGRYAQVTAHVDRCPKCQETVAGLEVPSDDLSDSLRRPLDGDEFEGEEGSVSNVVSRAEAMVEALSDASAASDTSRAAGLPGNDRQLGPYRLLRVLGSGGMGTVYKALHTRLDRIVAVKVLNARRLKDTDAVKRFEREMKAVGRLEHPHIVRATDADQDGDVHYLVMELVDGIDLSQLGRRLGPLPVAEACELMRQAAVGLQYVHHHGLVHRDFKPSNLMLTAGREGNADGKIVVKILDLGLALLAGEAEDGDLTSTDRIMGTIDYMAPEQLEDTHDVDIRADVYGLGAALYRLLAGRPPYSGEKQQSRWQKLAALAHDDVDSVSTHRDDLPAKLVALVDRLLSRNPDDRPQTPQAVVEALTPFTSEADLVELLDRAQSAPDPGPSPDSTAVPPRTVAVAKPPRRSKSVLGYVATLVLAVGVLAVWATNHLGTRRGPTEANQPGPLAAQTSEQTTDVDSPGPASDPATDPAAGLDLIELPNRWRIGKPVNLGETVNSDSHDQHPSLSADGLTLLFGSFRKGGMRGCFYWTSTRARIGGVWSEPRQIKLTGFDTRAELSADGLTLLFPLRGRMNTDDYDLWMATRPARDEPFGQPSVLKTNDSLATDVSPDLSEDGLTLLFESDRPGGEGQTDIWQCTRGAVDEDWQPPVNLGPVVNSPSLEGGPYLTADGLTLFFESDRTGSLGVADLWMCMRKSIEDEWKTPISLGSSVNTYNWDSGPVYSSHEHALYFHSRGLGGHGEADLWMVPLWPPKQPK